MANRASSAAVRSDSRLTVRNLMKAYHGRKVVQDVSLDVASGEVVGLLGPNGAGKTTCFYMIVGLVPSDGGSIELDGVPIGRLPIHRRARLGLSYLPQEASVFRKLSVEENIVAVLGRDEALVLDTRTTHLQAREIIDDLPELASPQVGIVENSHPH